MVKHVVNVWESMFACPEVIPEASKFQLNAGKLFFTHIIPRSEVYSELSRTSKRELEIVNGWSECFPSFQLLPASTQHKKWCFPSRISSVNLTKFARSWFLIANSIECVIKYKICDQTINSRNNFWKNINFRRFVLIYTEVLIVWNCRVEIYFHDTMPVRCERKAITK